MKTKFFATIIAILALTACSCEHMDLYGTCDMAHPVGIVGGKPTDSFGYMVRLDVHTPDGYGSCSGTVIGDRAILTARHCLQGEKFLVDRVDVHGPDDELIGVSTSFFPHASKDLAVIITRENIGLRSATLPDRPAYSLIGRDAIACGYGVDYYDPDGHGLKTAALSVAGLKGGQIVMDEHAQSVCYGDSGGALVYCGVVVGVLVTGGTDILGRCVPSLSFAEDVYPELDWIREIAEPHNGHTDSADTESFDG